MTKFKFGITSRILAAMILVVAILLFGEPARDGSSWWGISSALAQSSTATLNGTVEDETGAAVPNAAVTIINNETAFQRQTTANGEGNFTFTALPPGRYSLTVERQGFAITKLNDVVLNVNDQVKINIPLKVGEVSGNIVEVTEQPALVDDSPAVATTIDRQLIANLPLNGRSFQSLIALTPGVVTTQANFANQGQFSINGQRANSNYFTVDGVSANVGTSAGISLRPAGGGALPGLSAFGSTSNLVSVDALQEFKIQTSTYAPEFGRTSGGQIQISTRSGTNDFHGSAFDYLRNDALDANDFFANRNGLPKPALRQNDFGGVIGGPLFLPRFGEGGPAIYNGRDRTFFFFSYEGLRLRQPKVIVTEVPSLAARQLAPTAVKPLLNAYPIPNGPVTSDGQAQFSGSVSNPSTLDATSIRIDHVFSSKLTLFGRYNYAPSKVSQRGVSAFLSPSVIDSSRFKTQTLTFGTTQIFTNALNNEARFNYSKSSADTTERLDNYGGAVPLAESVMFPAGGSLNNDQYLQGLGNLGSLVAGKLAVNTLRQYNLVDNLSFVVGNHQLKFGADFRRLLITNDPRRTALIVAFTGVGSTAPGTTPAPGTALSGTAILVQVEKNSGGTIASNNFSAYGQDTWKVNKRLTLTYGVRWEVNPAPNGTGGQGLYTVQGLSNPATSSLAPLGTPFFKTTYNNFAPRFGASYQLSQKAGAETVIRGGVGIFYDLASSTLYDAYGSFPYSASRRTFFVPLPLTPAQLAPPVLSTTPTAARILATDPNLKLPRTYQWNLTLERSLGSNQVVSVAYVGAAGRKLLRNEVLNGVNTSFRQITAISNTATSDYHSLQLQYQRRLSRGLQTIASYTFAKSLDISSSETDNGGVPASKIDPRQDRGPSDFDIRHVFTAGFTYDIPSPFKKGIGRTLLSNFGLDGTFIARSSPPVNVTGGLQVLDFIGVVRPDLRPGIPLYISDPNAPGGRRLNNTIDPARPDCKGPFCTPVGAQGTLGRNALRGFPLYQLNLALRRQFSLTERLKLQLRAEAFNVFNRPNFASFVSDTSSGLFGQSTQSLGASLGSGGSSGGFSSLYQVGGPRSMQLSVKFLF